MKGASRMIYKRLLSPLLVCALIQAAMGRQSGSETAAPGDFTLTDHHGAKFRLADQRGKAILLFFGYTSCTEACPVILSRINSVFKQLGANPLANRRQSENPPWQATVEEEKQGRELLARVIIAMGGGLKIDGLTSYADVHKATVKLPQGDQEVGGRWIIEFVRGREGAIIPDRAREEV